MAELNGTQLNGTYAANRLKRFYPRPVDFLAAHLEISSAKEDDSSAEAAPRTSAQAKRLEQTDNNTGLEEQNDSSDENEMHAPRRRRRIRTRNQVLRRASESNIIMEIPPISEEMHRQYAGLKVVGESSERT